MSDTPRTDAFIKDTLHYEVVRNDLAAMADFARKLECELAGAVDVVETVLDTATIETNAQLLKAATLYVRKYQREAAPSVPASAEQKEGGEK